MRWVELESNANFRDVGGYRTDGGSITRWHTLYRCGSLDRTSDEDLATIYDLGVATVLDLRMDDERLPVASWHGHVAVVRTPLTNPATASFEHGSYDPAALYVACVPNLMGPLAEAVGVLADPRQLPTVISCSGGKDRTGMMMALLLTMLDVDRDTVLDDYALTDQFSVRDPGGYAAALDRVTSNGWDPEVLRTRPATIAAFLDEVLRQHGSARDLALAGGATVQELDRVAANLTGA